jgi:diadenosine tetraphosphatase ApaH/serine/threonine PP2A family protein phosphatase
MDLVRQRSIPTCQGCWDEDIIEGLNACDCSYPSQLAERRGHLAHQWTAAQLSEENKAYLASLPRSLRRDRLLFVHGSPNSQHEYLLPDMDAFAALERVETAGAETLFCGHTHRPYGRELRLPLRRIINAGSVGEPRHGFEYAERADDASHVCQR